MKRFAFFALGLMAFAAGALWGGQASRLLSDVDSRMILKQMSNKLGENKSLKARFVQERRLAMFQDVLRARGVFFYQSPGRVRWEFVEPYASIVLMLETGRVEKFDILEGRAQRVRTDGGQVLGEVLDRISGWLQGNVEQALQDFTFRMFQNRDYRLVLKPRSEALHSILSQIEFEIDSQSFLVLAISLWENETDVTVIRFLDQRVNEPLPELLFDVNNPRLLKEGKF